MEFTCKNCNCKYKIDIIPIQEEVKYEDIVTIYDKNSFYYKEDIVKAKIFGLEQLENSEKISMEVNYLDFTNCILSYTILYNILSTFDFSRIRTITVPSSAGNEFFEYLFDNPTLNSLTEIYCCKPISREILEKFIQKQNRPLIRRSKEEAMKINPSEPDHTYITINVESKKLGAEYLLGLKMNDTLYYSDGFSKVHKTKLCIKICSF